MSRVVIRDIVIPIVQKIMQQQGYYPGYRTPMIHDTNLEEFLEEELRRRFGVIGASDCQHLREQLEQAKKNDPYAFELTIGQLLEEYVKLATNLRYAERLKKLKENAGPPDRFSELRRRYKLLRRRY